jgi:hypothetical protein
MVSIVMRGMVGEGIDFRGRFKHHSKSPAVGCLDLGEVIKHDISVLEVSTMYLVWHEGR